MLNLNTMCFNQKIEYNFDPTYGKQYLFAQYFQFDDVSVKQRETLHLMPATDHCTHVMNSNGVRVGILQTQIVKDYYSRGFICYECNHVNQGYLVITLI